MSATTPSAPLVPSAVAGVTLPRRLVFGSGCIGQCVSDLATIASPRLLITSQHTQHLAQTILQGLANVHSIVIVDREPTFAMLDAALQDARRQHATGVIAVGGGSVLDLAKVVSVLLDPSLTLDDILGIDRVSHRAADLVCLPTTSGTGSEVSPNALLVDERDHAKKAVISRHIVPDAAYVDPDLTLGCPPGVSASSGIDAMVHGIEAYANKLAHPLIDPLALEAVRLTSRSVVRAVACGSDTAARSDMSLGSLLAGMCLGPVNTGAVHALAYPLGTTFGLSHGLSNAVLLTHVLRFNLSAAPARYAQLARQMGVSDAGDDRVTAQRGLEHLDSIVARCGIPARLRDVGVTESSIPAMAAQALTIRRLLDRNVRDVTLDDAIAIYREAF